MMALDISVSGANNNNNVSPKKVVLLSVVVLVTIVTHVHINKYFTREVFRGTELVVTNNYNNNSGELETTTVATTTAAATTAAVKTRRRPRVLVGIFSADFATESKYRNMHRALLQTNPTIICRLGDFMQYDDIQNGPCELIYTFVLGGGGNHNNNDDNQTDVPPTTQLLYNTSQTPIIAPIIPKSNFSTDFNETDMTFLNIRENMNDGKSQTWLYYASLIMNHYDIEYAMKLDTDSLLYLDRYFTFVESSLPPSPYNIRILAGIPIDKDRWRVIPDSNRKIDNYLKDNYSTHMYVGGPMYIISRDLVEGIVHVARHDKTLNESLAHVEDHDISTMAFLSVRYDNADNNNNPTPIKFIMIPNRNPFWKHGVKLKFGFKNWKNQWDGEIERIKNITATLSNNITDMQ